MPLYLTEGVIALVCKRFIQALCALLAAAAALVVTGLPAYAGTDDYPAEWKNAAQDSVLDTWREYNRECTSFAAWRLHSRNGFEMPFFDNAAQWGTRAAALGYAVNKTPAVGAIAWWNWSHVAWVESISTDGRIVHTEDYNSNSDGKYGQHDILVGSPTGYIHFKDIASGGTGGLSLAFIKTKNVGQGQVEVHRATAESGYRSVTPALSTISAGEADNGWFSLTDMNRDGVADVAFVKTRNTASGAVEVHWRDGTTGYTAGYAGGTAYGTSEAGSGWFQVADFDRDGTPDFVYIKTHNTASGRIEVNRQRALPGGGYGSPVGYAAPLGTGDADSGWFRLVDNTGDAVPDLVFIKTKNVPSGHVEVYTYDGACGYCRIVTAHSASTVFGTGEDTNGWFSIADMNGDGQGDLVFIKTRNTGSGRVELFVADAAGQYQRVTSGNVTAFSPQDASNGWFQVAWG